MPRYEAAFERGGGAFPPVRKIDDKSEDAADDAGHSRGRAVELRSESKALTQRDV